jgi:hypothetical protein
VVGERHQREGRAWIMELGLRVIVRMLDTLGVKFSDGCKFGMNSPSFEGEEGGHSTVQLTVLLFSVSFL